MVKQLCRLCNQRHHLGEPHRWDGGAINSNATVAVAINISTRTANGRAREDYNAYMREYMRRRRRHATDPA